MVGKRRMLYSQHIPFSRLSVEVTLRSSRIHTYIHAYTYINTTWQNCAFFGDERDGMEGDPIGASPAPQNSLYYVLHSTQDYPIADHLLSYYKEISNLFIENN